MRTSVEGLVIALVGAVAAWGAMQVPAAPEGETWAGVVPMAVAAGLLLAGLSMAVTGLRSALADGRIAGLVPSRTSLEVLGLLALSLAYQQSMVMCGYLLPTAIAAPIMLAAFGVRNIWGLAASVVICPLGFHVIFFELLGVFPPVGEIFDPLDLIRG